MRITAAVSPAGYSSSAEVSGDEVRDASAPFGVRVVQSEPVARLHR